MLLGPNAVSYRRRFYLISKLRGLCWQLQLAEFQSQPSTAKSFELPAHVCSGHLCLFTSQLYEFDKARLNLNSESIPVPPTWTNKSKQTLNLLYIYYAVIRKSNRSQNKLSKWEEKRVCWQLWRQGLCQKSVLYFPWAVQGSRK